MPVPRMVMGDNVRVKALVGTSSIAADAQAGESTSHKGSWFERDKWPQPNADTGAALQVQTLNFTGIKCSDAQPLQLVLVADKMSCAQALPGPQSQCASSAIRAQLSCACREAKVSTGACGSIGQPGV